MVYIAILISFSSLTQQISLYVKMKMLTTYFFILFLYSGAINFFDFVNT